MNPVLPLINVPIVEKAIEQDFAMEPTGRPFQGVSEETLQDGDCKQGGKEGEFGRRLSIAGDPNRASEQQSP